MERYTSRDTKPLGAKRLERGLSTRRAISVLTIASIFFLTLTAVGAWYFLKTHRDVSDITTELTPPSSLTELIEDYPELSSILQDTALDSVYKEFLIVYQDQGEQAALDLARKRGLLGENDELRLTLELDTTETESLKEEFEARGIQVTASGGYQMDIAIPLELLQESLESERPGSLFLSITGIEHIVRVRTPMFGTQDAGNVELDSLWMIDAESWQTEGFSGQGVTVAVLDGGFDGYQDLLGSDLPVDVVTRSFIDGYVIDQTGTAHGTACAEIVHDIAPDAKLYLVGAWTVTEAEQAVDWLISEDVDIITQSVNWFYGPKDGTGPVTHAVKRAVDNGIFWVNSAGNNAESHYRGYFTDRDGDGFHEFSSDDEMMAFEPEGYVKFTLNWDDWEIGDQDVDLLVVDADKNTIASSVNVQSGPGDSVEYISYEFTDNGLYSIVFYGAHVTRPVLFDFFLYNGTIEYYSKEYSLGSPADAREAIAVGATYWEDDSLESFSSHGPTNDERLKPDISAPDGTYSAAYGGQFFGTSASTPHVAGAAALILQAHPEFGPHEISEFLKSRALDLGPSGPDYSFGYGRLQLGEPPAFGVLPTQPAILPTALPSATLMPTQATPPTADPTITLEPTRRSFPTPTPESDAGSSNLAFSFLACVVMPGVLGLSCIGILGAVLYRRRTGRSRPRYDWSYTPPQPYYPQFPAQDVQNKGPWLCPRCGSPHRQGARFCPTCGYSLDLGAPEYQIKHCTHCGQPLRPNSKFCTQCGRSISK